MASRTSKIVLCSSDQALLHEMSRASAPIYTVLSTANRNLAAEYLARQEGVTVVATDNTQLLADARQFCPGARRVLVTDYDNLREIVQGLHDETIHHVTDKPLRERDFLAAIAPMASRPAPAQAASGAPHNSHSQNPASPGATQSLSGNSPAHCH
jgi:hypothetical protein